jgi:hypothetical protein
VNQRGQAMVEFAVAVAVLILLLAGMPVIHRYHELQVATIEGARLLAFEGSWRPAPATRPAAEALRGSLLPPAADATHPDAQSIDAQFSTSDPPGRAGAAERILLAPFVLARSAGSAFDLRTRAFQRLRLNVTVSRPTELPDPFAGIPVTLSAQYALLGDGWSGAGPEQVAQRSGALVITRAASSLRPLISLGAGLLSLVEPAFRQFCPGIVDPEQLPADRLGRGAVAGPVTTWRLRC